jgi:hypothetical protein
MCWTNSEHDNQLHVWKSAAELWLLSRNPIAEELNSPLLAGLKSDMCPRFRGCGCIRKRTRSGANMFSFCNGHAGLSRSNKSTVLVCHLTSFCLKSVIDHWLLVHQPPHGWLTTTKFIQFVIFVTPAAVASALIPQQLHSSRSCEGGNTLMRHKYNSTHSTGWYGAELDLEIPRCLHEGGRAILFQG